jgi:hypothetical protein
MRIHRNLLAAAASTIVAAGTIAGTGMLTASAAPRAAATQHFQIVSTSATSPKADVLLSGPITAHAVDIQGSKSDVFKLANGSFVVKHSPGKGPQTFDPKTCLATVNQHGTYTVGHGTGAYKGISGSGKYHVSVLVIGGRVHGHCSMKKAPVAFQLVIDASGPIHR